MVCIFLAYIFFILSISQSKVMGNYFLSEKLFDSIELRFD